jgi:hypothetical protein
MGHDLVITDLGNLVIEADAIMVDPYYVSAIGSQHKGCYVQSQRSSRGLSGYEPDNEKRERMA